jgi:hypothetical protein
MPALRANLTPHEIEGSAYWASYLINNDASGLTDEEVALADAWLVANGLEHSPCVDVGEPFFSWSYGFHTGADCQGGDLAEYTFLIASEA